MRLRILQALACGIAVAVLRWWEPVDVSYCGFRWLTGTPCPLCGLTRALFALAKGDWERAFEFHLFSPLAAAVLAGSLLISIARVFKVGQIWRPPTVFWKILTWLFVAFGAIRAFSGSPVHAADRRFEFSGEIRGRAEGYTGIDYTPDRNDAYYLHRIRLTGTFKPTSWLRFTGQVQDAHAPGYAPPRPASVVDTFDLRLGFAEIGRDAESGWSARLGRQDLAFGEERLVGASNWGNVGRSFDAVRLTYVKPGRRLDWFASTVVRAEKHAFDQSDVGSRLYGFYGVFEHLWPGGRFEPYFFWKSERSYRNDLGNRGRLEVLTFGARTTGVANRWEYGAETAGQTGTAAGASVAAWAGHYQLGYALGKAPQAPRLIGIFNLASGDSNPQDGWLNTFDQLYPTNHSYYGIADRIGWRNMREIAAGVQWRPMQSWRIGLDYHLFWLATVKDALYLSGGAVSVRNPNATSRRVDDELDLTASYQLNKHLGFVFGYAHIFPREFLRESTPGSPTSLGYGMWTLRF